MIHEYYNNITVFRKDKWTWNLSNKKGNHELYIKHRARRALRERDYYKNCDILPDFTSIEADANYFGRTSATFTDIFGIEWEGSRGVYESLGSPDYEGHLYYYDEEEDDYSVTDEYDSFENKPSADVFTEITDNYGYKKWVDIKNIKEIKYHYITWNHLFKDTWFEFTYADDYIEEEILEDGRFVHTGKLIENKHQIHSNADYHKLLRDIERVRPDLLPDLLATINKHFCELRDSDKEECRAFYPNCTAEEYFGFGK